MANKTSVNKSFVTTGTIKIGKKVYDFLFFPLCIASKAGPDLLAKILHIGEPF